MLNFCKDKIFKGVWITLSCVMVFSILLFIMFNYMFNILSFVHLQYLFGPVSQYVTVSDCFFIFKFILSHQFILQNIYHYHYFLSLQNLRTFLGVCTLKQWKVCQRETSEKKKEWRFARIKQKRISEKSGWKDLTYLMHLVQNLINIFFLKMKRNSNPYHINS